jgi:hypothetical protein
MFDVLTFLKEYVGRDSVKKPERHDCTLDASPTPFVKCWCGLPYIQKAAEGAF